MKTEMNVVEKMVKGSRNIDEMRRRIVLSVGSLIGIMELLALNLEGSGTWPLSIVKITINNNLWELKVFFGRRSHEYFITCSFGGGNAIYTSRMTCEDSYTVKYHHVQALYQSLPVFIEEIFKKFPEVREACQPFFVASELDLG